MCKTILLACVYVTIVLECAKTRFYMVPFMLHLYTYFVNTHCLYSLRMCICYNCVGVCKDSFLCGPFYDASVFACFVQT